MILARFPRLSSLNFGLPVAWGREMWIKEPSCLVLPALYKHEMRSQVILLIQVLFTFETFVSQELVITGHHLCFMMVWNFV